MSKYKRQSHVVYKCDYHIVWVPKYRLRILTGEVGKLVYQDKEIKWMVRVWSNGTEGTGWWCSCGSKHTAKSIGVNVYGNNKREDSNKDVQELSEVEKETLLGKSFLGKRIFCKYGWSEWRNDKEIGEISGRRGT